MNTLERIGHWGDTHHPLWIDIIRIFLGIFLVYTGILFLENTSSIVSLVGSRLSFSQFALVLITHYVVFAHILGGILIAAGVLTRFAALIQIPILLGALVLVNNPAGIMKPYSIWLVSFLVLLLLIYFLIAGNGKLSLNWEEKTKNKT
jgi:putative oxidoreductase